MAAAYGLVAFVVVQVADIAFPALRLPDWTLTLVVALAIIGFPLALVLAWAYDMTPEGVMRTGSAPAADSMSAVLVPPNEAERKVSASRVHDSNDSIHSIAVLPFVNGSADPENEYFSDGLTEELLNKLAKTGSLRVPARTSSFAFKGQSVDVREIGKKLNVDTVLEGSVRKVGTRLRITAQLIDVADGYHRWSESYDRELTDVFAIQEEISTAIVTTLGVRLTGGQRALLAAQPTSNVNAYDLYLRGRHLWAQGTLSAFKTALDYFGRALQQDPSFALAHLGIADVYLLGVDAYYPPDKAYPRIRAAAIRALELDPKLAEAHGVLGWVKAAYDWDWAGAEADLLRSVQLNPSSGPAHFYHTLFLSAAGRHDEAIVAGKRAMELDPLSPVVSYFLGAWGYHWARHVDGMRAQAMRLRELDPNSMWYHDLLGLISVAEGNLEAAIAEFQKAVTIEQHPVYEAHLAHALAVSGRRDDALLVLEQLKERANEGYMAPSVIAWIYTGLGEVDEAFTWLNKAVEQHDGLLLMLNGEPISDALRDDPRFDHVLKKMGLQ